MLMLIDFIDRVDLVDINGSGMLMRLGVSILGIDISWS